MAEPTNDEAFAYLERLRESGETNMWGAPPYLVRRFGVSVSRSRELFSLWKYSREKPPVTREQLMARALLRVVAAVRDYLPPDGIGKDTTLNLIIAAVDNREINPVIAALELEDDHGRG
jgi:hypothetical protein